MTRRIESTASLATSGNRVVGICVRAFREGAPALGITPMPLAHLPPFTLPLAGEAPPEVPLDPGKLVHDRVIVSRSCLAVKATDGLTATCPRAARPGWDRTPDRAEAAGTGPGACFP